MPSYVVSGASRGIGLEFVVQLLAKGNVVFALVRNPEGSKALSAIKNKNLHVIKADITDLASVKAAAAEVAKITGGSLDVLINNAAYQNAYHTFHSILEFSSDEDMVEDFNTSYQTNVMGPIFTTNAFIPLLKKGTLKKVLTLATGIGEIDLTLASGYVGHPSYCVSKAALVLAVSKYAVALKDEGFTFLSISPGVVNTAEAPPPPEAMPLIQKMAGGFQKVYPHWQGPISPTESVGYVLNVFDNVKPEDTGKFLSHLGNKEWL